MDTRITISVMQPEQVAEAKRTILAVAATVYPERETQEEWTARMMREGVLADVDNYRAIYAPPDGIFLLAMDGERVIGTVAVHRWDETTAELKRMWLLHAYHGQGIGYALARRALDFALGAGYVRIRLSTQHRQERAIAFYRRLGFDDIERYNDLDDELFLQLDLEPNYEPDPANSDHEAGPGRP